MHHTGALLLAIGLVPVACGGVASNSDRDGGGSGGSSNAGKGP